MNTIWTQQAVMDAIKALACPNGCVKHKAIVTHTGLAGRQVANACAKLVDHGYLTRDKYCDATVKPGCYTLTKLGLVAQEEGARLTSGPKGAHGKSRAQEDTLRDRAWRVLRIRKKVSAPELVGLLLNAGESDSEIKRATNNLNTYLRNLTAAGYLMEMRREAPRSINSNGAKRFLLVRDTGQKCPILRIKSKKVYDQNEGREYATSEA